VGRLCQSGATKSSVGRKVTMRATGYWVRTKRGVLELHGTAPLRAGLSVSVKALRVKGTQIQLLYARGGDQWLARFSRIKGRGALKGKVVSSYKGRLRVRLKLGHRSIKPTSLRQVKRAARPGTLPDLPVANRLRGMFLDTNGGYGCASPDSNWDSFWSRSGPGWTGGDSTYTTTLPDGRIAWLFGDTFLGTVATNGSRPADSPMVRNSMVVQSGDQIATRTSNGPSAFVNTPDGQGWYWPGAETVYGGQLKIFLTRFHASGGGLWDFVYDSTAIATLNPADQTLQSLTPVADAGGLVHWGSWTLQDGGYTYIYGTETSGLHNWMHVARAPLGQLGNAWEYWNGSTWTTDPNSSARVLDGVSNQFSVVKRGTNYVLISQGVALSRNISAWQGSTPWGAWTDKTTVYTTPQWSDSFTYNALAHPELSDGQSLLVSYNVNSSSGTGAYGNADLYRPRFIRVPLSCLPGA
jgi:hypothetical protein